MVEEAGPGPDADARQFNPGQKLNAAFTGAAIVVMLATGSVMQWFRALPRLVAYRGQPSSTTCSPSPSSSS